MTAALRALRERLAGAGIDCELESPRPEKPPQRATRPAAVATNTVVLGDGYSLARRVVSAARAAELEIDAVAIVTPSSIEAALLALHDSPAAANLIVALHASPKLSTLRTMARSTPGATLLCVGNARRIIDARAAVEELSTLGVARAHGIVACDVPAVSVDARALALGGLLPRGSRDFDALCVSREVTRLMRDAAVAGGLELVGKGGTRVGGVRVEPRSELADPAAAALMVSELASAGREALLVLVAPELGLADGPRWHSVQVLPLGTDGLLGSGWHEAQAGAAWPLVSGNLV